MSAVGAYSGPRAVCGVVAQPAKTERHVMLAMRRSRIGVFEDLGFMRFGLLSPDVSAIVSYLLLKCL